VKSNGTPRRRQTTEQFVECVNPLAHQRKYHRRHPDGGRIVCFLCHPPAAVIEARREGR
jgi:hypothetical protein